MYFDSWQSHELRVAIMRNAQESGVERMWETGQNKMVENGMFSRYVKEGKKSLKYT